MNFWQKSLAKRRYEGRRREDADLCGWSWRDLGPTISMMRPRIDFSAPHQMSYSLKIDECTVWNAVKNFGVDRLLASFDCALSVQLFVNFSDWWIGDSYFWIRSAPRCFELFVAVSTAFSAGPVPGAKCGRLVQKEQLGIVAGAKNRALPSWKIKRACHPGFAPPRHHDALAVVVEDPAIAQPRPSCRDRF